jgi:hypothetical protein
MRIRLASRGSPTSGPSGYVVQLAATCENDIVNENYTTIWPVNYTGF